MAFRYSTFLLTFAFGAVSAITRSIFRASEVTLSLNCCLEFIHAIELQHCIKLLVCVPFALRYYWHSYKGLMGLHSGMWLLGMGFWI